MAVAYVEHPVTKEEKRSYKREFDKIVDIKFAPSQLKDGDKMFPKTKKDKK
jgi:hypothetical protein